MFLGRNLRIQIKDLECDTNIKTTKNLKSDEVLEKHKEDIEDSLKKENLELLRQYR